MTVKSTADMFWSLLFPWHNTRLIERTAGDIAGCCQRGLGWRVYNRTACMSIPETKGYVRALAAGCVCREVDQRLSGGRLPQFELRPTLRKKLEKAAIDKLTLMATKCPPAKADSVVPNAA